MSAEGRQPIDFDDGFRVGEFEVYPKRLALVRDGESTRLEPKVMAVLVHLAERAGQVVTRNEFADEVWRGRIVSDEVLFLFSRFADQYGLTQTLLILTCGFWLIAFFVTPFYYLVYPNDAARLSEAMAKRRDLIAGKLT